MPIFSRLFGRRPAPEAAPASSRSEHYQGYVIHAEPVREGSQWRISARIEKEVGGVLKSYRLIRADLLGDADTAAAESLRKARRLIDEQGDGIFDAAR